MGKKAKGFHTPFADLKAKVQLPAPAKAPPKRPPPVGEKPASDEELLADEMLGVQPLPPDPRGRLGAPQPNDRPRPSRRASDEAEAYALLADLVDGTGAFDISDTDEYVEGLAEGIDRRLLRQLKRGDYAIQAHLDLHGLTAEEARPEVERFVDGARAAGKRCVLIIHGRGHGSKDGIPVLKERMKVWLSRGRLSKAVLAFCTARPADGGAGAVYLLLRK